MTRNVDFIWKYFSLCFQNEACVNPKKVFVIWVFLFVQLVQRKLLSNILGHFDIEKVRDESTAQFSSQEYLSQRYEVVKVNSNRSRIPVNVGVPQ